MNYLAHIYLSYNNDDILIGNFAADFITNKQIKKFSEDQVNGVLLHRLIDAFTDIHPKVKKNTRILRDIQGKYAPVVSDIIFDYILAKNWETFHDEPLRDFSEKIYQRLLTNIDKFPLKAQAKVIGMAGGKFIRSYESIEGISSVFRRMDKRTKFPSRFSEAAEQIVEHEEEITRNFMDFFPELKTKTDGFLRGLQYETEWK